MYLPFFLYIIPFFCKCFELHYIAISLELLKGSDKYSFLLVIRVCVSSFHCNYNCWLVIMTYIVNDVTKTGHVNHFA